MKIRNECDADRKYIEKTAKLAIKSIGKIRIDRPQNESDEIMKRLATEFPAFMKSYSIIMKYAVYVGMYSPIAVKHYLKWVEHHPWITSDDYLKAQAMYVGILYRCLRKVTADIELQIREKAYKSLKDDHDKFISDNQNIAKEVESKFAKLRKKRNDELIEWCKASIALDDCQNAGVVGSEII